MYGKRKLTRVFVRPVVGEGLWNNIKWNLYTNQKKKKLKHLGSESERGSEKSSFKKVTCGAASSQLTSNFGQTLTSNWYPEDSKNKKTSQET